MRKILCLIISLSLAFSLAACTRGSPGETAAESRPGEEPLFPLSLENGSITVEKPQGLDGLFVERGNLDEVKNTTAVTVTNNSGRMLEYGLISLKVNGIERAEFEISALPAGESAVVMESFARPFFEDDEYELEKSKSVFAFCDAETNPGDVDVSVIGADFSVTNKSGEGRNIIVIYKYYSEEHGKYYGGIAFRGKFENVAPGETVKKTSDRFNGDCRIVNIITENITESEVIQ